MTTLFKSLDRAEKDLSKSSGPYYHGDRVTEADVRLYTVSCQQSQRAITLNADWDRPSFVSTQSTFSTSNAISERFVVAILHCTSKLCYIMHNNVLERQLTTCRWVRYLYWKNDAFGSTTEFTHIKNHYTKSHRQINQFSITPLGPEPSILPLDEEVAAVKAAVKPN